MWGSLSKDHFFPPGDGPEFLLLLILYILQGIPMGLCSSVPLLLHSKLTYKQQSYLSLASIPFSLKLLWAPVVDGKTLSRLGRRRSWIIPVQLCAAFLMIFAGCCVPFDCFASSLREFLLLPLSIVSPSSLPSLFSSLSSSPVSPLPSPSSNERYSDSSLIDLWLGEREGETPNVSALMYYFGLLYFLMATQDIAVDGWALTILKPENRGWASTCNTIGQSFGYILSYVGFLALNDVGTADKIREFLRGCFMLVSSLYSSFMMFFSWHSSSSLSASSLPSPPSSFLSDMFLTPSNEPLVSLGGFLFFWGVVMLVMTVVVLFFFDENKSNNSTCNNNKKNDIKNNPLQKKDNQKNAKHKKFENERHEENQRELKQIRNKTKDDNNDENNNRNNSQEMMVQNRDHNQSENNGYYHYDTDHFDLMLHHEHEYEPQGIVEAYTLLFKLLFLRPLLFLCFLLLFSKIGYAATDSATFLMMLKSGAEKQELASVAALLSPLAIVTPIAVGKLVNGPKPLHLFRIGLYLRLFMACVWMFSIPLFNYIHSTKTNHSSLLFFVLSAIIGMCYNFTSDIMFVSQMSFYAQISDARIGGTYMTFLNTVSNIASKWPTTLSLYLMDSSTIRLCEKENIGNDSNTCPVYIDGYYVQVTICVILGLIYVLSSSKGYQYLEDLPRSCWKIDIDIKNDKK